MLVGLGAICLAMISGVSENVSTEFPELLRDWFYERRQSEAMVRKVFQDIFGIRSEIRSVKLGSKGYSTATGYHPDNQAGGKVISEVLILPECDPERIFDANNVITHIGDIISVGGSTSTLHTRIALECDGSSNDEMNRPAEPIIRLPYYGLSDLRQVKRWGGVKMEGVGSVAVLNWYVVCTDSRRSQREIIPELSLYETVPVRRGRSIEYVPAFLDNYLLVTRLPNFLSLDFTRFLEEETDMSQWSSMVIFAGMNGIGTRAVELLTQPEGLALLQSIKNIVNQMPAFQLLFRVSNIKLMEETDRGFYKANKIDLFHDPAPIELTPKICWEAHKYAMARLFSSKENLPNTL
jgi:hypothetical protein